MSKSEAWQAGFDAGKQPRSGVLASIEPPEHYTDEQHSDFISGFLAGTRAAWNDVLIAEMMEAPMAAEPPPPEFTSRDYADLATTIRLDLQNEPTLRAVLSNNLNIIIGALDTAAEVEARVREAELRGWEQAVDWLEACGHEISSHPLVKARSPYMVAKYMRAELARRRERT